MLNYNEAYAWIRTNNDKISDKDAKVVAAVMSAPTEVKKGLQKVRTNAPHVALLAVITPIMLVDRAVDEVKRQMMDSYNEYVKEHGNQI